MKITIFSSNIKITKSINDYVEKKVKSFERPLKAFLSEKDEVLDDSKREVIECIWELGTESSGLRRGAFFSKVRIISSGKIKEIIASTKGRTLQSSVDKAKDMVLEQIVEKKKKPESIKKKEAVKVKKSLKSSIDQSE